MGRSFHCFSTTRRYIHHRYLPFVFRNIKAVYYRFEYDSPCVYARLVIKNIKTQCYGKERLLSFLKPILNEKWLEHARDNLYLSVTNLNNNLLEFTQGNVYSIFQP